MSDAARLVALTLTDEQRTKMRDFIAKRAAKVQYDAMGNVSTYGWSDYAAHVHTSQRERDGDHCLWVVPVGAVLQERVIRQFVDTFTGGADEVGLEVEHCHCTCGRYTDVTLRWDGSLGDLLLATLGSSGMNGVVL